MPKAHHLSTTEIEIIRRMITEGVEVSNNAVSLNRSRAAVYSVRRNPGRTSMQARSGRPSKMSPICKRHLIREGKNKL